MTVAAGGKSILDRLFMSQQAVLRAALAGARSAIDHPTLKGDASELHWHDMLTTHLPRRYRVTKGVVVDSLGAKSDAIDLIIHDAHFCPLLLESAGTSFVPAESVYAVLEVKQAVGAKEIAYAGKKALSVRQLHRTSAAIIDRGEARAARSLPPILAGVLGLETEWADGLGIAFHHAMSELPEKETLDMGCFLNSGAFLREANGSPELKVSPEGIALVAFFLGLVARLQLLGTVPAIDWASYLAAVLEP